MTRPERTSRAGPLAVTFSLRRIHFSSLGHASHPRAAPVHEPRPSARANNLGIRCLMNSTRLFSPFSFFFVSSIVNRPVCEFHRFLCLEISSESPDRIFFSFVLEAIMIECDR